MKPRMRPGKNLTAGEESDAHYWILWEAGRRGPELPRFCIRTQAFSTWVLPANESPDALTRAAWGCLESPYTHAYGREYGYAMAYASRAVTLYQDTARSQEAQLASFKSPPEVAANGKFWALNTVGSSYFIIGNAWMMMSYDLISAAVNIPTGCFRDKPLQLAGLSANHYPDCSQTIRA